MSRIKTSQSEVEPNITIRGSQTIYHHLFKGLVSKMKKNVSWKPGAPNLQDVEHVHFYHSCNSTGLPQKYTNEIGGHFHEITWKYDSEGKPLATCGPALKRISKRGRDGHSIIKIVPVKWVDKFAGDDEDEGDTADKIIADAHVHEMEYKGSDQITNKDVQERQKVTAKAMIARSVKIEGSDEVDVVDNDR